MSADWSAARLEKVGRLIQSLCGAVKELEAEFIDDKRRFTLDGHLVGTIGEVVAAYAFGVTLYPPSKKTHDGKCSLGEVQIKLTGGKRIVFTGDGMPEYLLVMQLIDHRFTLVYNGPGVIVWKHCTAKNHYNQRSIGVKKLRHLQAEVPSGKLIPMLRKLPDFSTC